MKKLQIAYLILSLIAFLSINPLVKAEEGHGCNGCSIPKRMYGMTVSWTTTGCLGYYQCHWMCWQVQDPNACCCNNPPTPCSDCSPEEE